MLALRPRAPRVRRAKRRASGPTNREPRCASRETGVHAPAPPSLGSHGALGYASNIDANATHPVHAPAPAWWGTFGLPEDAAVVWRVGPLELWLQRRANEWRVGTVAGANALDERVSVAQPAAGDEAPEGATLTRYSFARAPARVTLSPRTADRPVVVRPDAPFFVPGGEEARLYLSTPLWIALAPPDAPRPMLEVPAHRPSDTWFGPNTLEGELCYAAVTHARLDLASLPRRPHRAVTPVLLRNRAAEPLLLERLKVPLPYLSLFADASGMLWTELVTLERETAGDVAALQIGSDAPAEAAARVDGTAAREPTRLCEPRQRPEPRVALRAFSRLFRGM